MVRPLRPFLECFLASFLFWCLLVSASGFVSPPVALALGLVFGLTLPHPYGREAKKSFKYLLQASVVGLGFGMNSASGRAGRAQRLCLYPAGDQLRAWFVGMGLGASA